jgi:pimeloyl-ACP methyl ester carboxylesterase
MSLAATGPGGETWFTAAWLTLPAEQRRSELQVLVHGAGYDHRYWDWPAQPEHYSYVRWATERGIATLNIDRIGSGSSSLPAGTENTIAAQTEVLCQLLADVRRGLADAEAFERVVLIGHSLGSVVSGCAAAHCGDDVDAVVLTGYLPVDHGESVEGQFLEKEFVPAIEALPHLRGLVDDDYLASNPATRQQFMFRLDAVDPEILAVDHDIRGATSRGELRGGWTAGNRVLRAAAPTLSLVGQYDVLVQDPAIDKDSFESVERIRGACPPNFDFEVVPDTGHNLNLHRNAPATYERLNAWLDRQAANSPPALDKEIRSG